jgi:hypothetical protein
MRDQPAEGDYGPQNAALMRSVLSGADVRAALGKPDLVLTPPGDEKAERKTRHLEQAQQIAYFDRVRQCLDQDGHALPHRPGADLIHAIGNENAAGKAIGVLRWKMGVKKGMPDICIPVPRDGFCGLYIELKREDGVASDIQPEQLSVHDRLSNLGWNVVVAYGWRRAFSVTAEYLGWTDHPLYPKT